MNLSQAPSIGATLVCAILCLAQLAPGTARAESVFEAGTTFGPAPGGLRGVGAAAGFGVAAAYAAPSAQDTIETFDVELEAPEKGMSIYKEIAIVALVSGAVGFAVYQLIKSDDEQSSEDDGGSGKPTPFDRAFRIRLPIIR